MAMMGAKMVGGIIQTVKGNQILKNTKMPDYMIPTQLNENLQLAKDLKNMGGMPSASMNASTQSYFRNANFGMGQLQGRRAAVAGVASILQRLNDASTNLAMQDANMAMGNRRAGISMQSQANNAMAQQQLAKQQWEKFNPYLRKMSEGQALVGAGMQNMFGAVTGAAQANMYENMYGDSSAPGNQSFRSILRQNNRAVKGL